MDHIERHDSTPSQTKLQDQYRFEHIREHVCLTSRAERAAPWQTVRTTDKAHMAAPLPSMCASAWGHAAEEPSSIHVRREPRA